MPGKSIEELKAEAELLYPYPFNACAYTIMRVDWKRNNYVKANS